MPAKTTKKIGAGKTKKVKTAKKTTPKLYPDLKSFLKADENTVTRERLLFHRFCFDMYLAAAKARYPLAVLSIEVDREGFDVVLDDGDRERRIQLKAFDGDTKSWDSTKRFLRPEGMLGQSLGFKTNIEGIGVGGAFVVMGYDTNDPELQLRYLFCDAHILTAFAKGWVPRKQQKGRGKKAGDPNTAEKYLDELNTGIGSEGVSIPKGLFVEAKGPDELLALLEMHSLKDHQWCSMLSLRLGPEYRPEIHGPVEKQISTALAELIVI